MAAVCLAALAGISCQGQVTLPPRPTVVDVTMREYTYDFRPGVPPGRTVFRVHNAGRLEHQIELLPLPPDFPPVNTHPHSPSGKRYALTPLANLPARAAGRNGTFAVDLTPGRYGFLCFVIDPDGVQHTFKGMQAEFQVR